MNKQKSTEQTKKQQKTWIKIIKIVGIVLICLILFALIAFGVLRALGKSGISKIFQAKHRYSNPRNQPKRAGRMDGSAIMVRSMPTTKIS